jgi:hypothetical protein
MRMEKEPLAVEIEVFQVHACIHVRPFTGLIPRRTGFFVSALSCVHE